jgi:glycosyltransferase involved in cell wall biosynthesis
MKNKKKIIYVVAEDAYFCSHRIDLAKSVLNQGFDVYVVTQIRNHRKTIKDAKIKVIPFIWDRRSKNPFKAFVQIYKLYKIYKKINPDLIHQLAVKPVLFGSIAALFLPSTQKPFVINALTGLGYIFTSNSILAKVLKLVTTFILKYVLNQKRTNLILQNPDDQQLIIEKCAVPQTKMTLIRGSGVNTDEYISWPEPDSPPLQVMFASRLLRDKGIFEFVEAACLLKEKKLPINFIVVGAPDPHNPSSLTHEQLKKLQENKVVEWWGHHTNMKETWRKCHVAVLPSYREGLPKALLEAAATGRAIVTTNAPGCKEVVDDGVNGFLVPVQSISPLAEAIEKLLNNDLRHKMADESRNKIVTSLSLEYVIKETLSLYTRSLQQ